MAGEIKVSSSLGVVKANAGGLTDNESGLSFNQTGTHTQQTIQDVGFATHELVAIAADLGTPGWSKFKNLDPTNTIQLGLVVAAVFYPFAIIPPGGVAGPFCIDAAAVIYCKAAVASCRMRNSIAEV